MLEQGAQVIEVGRDEWGADGDRLASCELQGVVTGREHHGGVDRAKQSEMHAVGVQESRERHVRRCLFERLLVGLGRVAGDVEVDLWQQLRHASNTSSIGSSSANVPAAVGTTTHDIRFAGGQVEEGVVHDDRVTAPGAHELRPMTVGDDVRGGGARHELLDRQREAPYVGERPCGTR